MWLQKSIDASPYFKSQASLTFQPLTFDLLDICPCGFRLMDAFFLPRRQLLVSVYFSVVWKSISEHGALLEKFNPPPWAFSFIFSSCCINDNVFYKPELFLGCVELDVTLTNIVFVFFFISNQRFLPASPNPHRSAGK